MGSGLLLGAYSGYSITLPFYIYTTKFDLKPIENMLESIIRMLTGTSRQGNAPDGILDIEKDDSVLDTDMVERAGIELHNALPDSSVSIDSLLFELKHGLSKTGFIAILFGIGLVFGLLTDYPMGVLQAVSEHIYGVDVQVVQTGVQETSSAYDRRLWLRIGNALTGAFLGGSGGLFLWPGISTLKIEPASSGQQTFQVSASACETDKLYPRYIIDNASPLNLVGPIQNAHSSTIQLKQQEISDDSDAVTSNPGQGEDCAVYAREIRMEERNPQDSFQQGLSAWETAPSDSNDFGYPIDEIGRLLNEVEVPIHFQVVVRSLTAGDVLSDEYTAEISPADDSRRAAVTDRNRKENVDRDPPRKFFHLNARMVAFVDTDSPRERKRAETVMTGIENAIEDILPEYVTTSSIGGYSNSWNPIARLRATRIKSDYRTRRFRKDRPSRIKTIIGSQSRRNLIIGASTIWGLLTIPGAGRKESRRAFDIVPKDQWPSGQPSPSFQEEIEAEYDPHRTANRAKSATDDD